MEQDEKILTELSILVRGNGTKETGLVHRTIKLEQKFHDISIKLTVVVVLLLILISVQTPALLAGIKGI